MNTGIPKTAEGRFEVAKRIVAATDAIGIPRGDVYIDCLTLTVSAEQSAAAETLKAITMCKKELGVRTVLGVSNISFGLPCRGYMNTTFLTLAMQAGLDLAIMNPNTPEMMAAVRAYRVLTSQDEKCNDYVAAYANVQVQTSQVAKTDAAAPAGGAAGADALFEAVRRGLKNEARAAAEEALKTREPLQVVNETLIPALDVVGDAFEKGSIFLPQLLQSATATQAAFEVIKTAIAASGSQGESKGRIVIATVKGDVHDIGKNIVRVILENYGYDVLDLGRDVPPERVVEAVRQTRCALVGLCGPDDHHRAQHAGHHRSPARGQPALQGHGGRRCADQGIRRTDRCRFLCQGRQSQRRLRQTDFWLIESSFDFHVSAGILL